MRQRGDAAILVSSFQKEQCKTNEDTEDRCNERCKHQVKMNCSLAALHPNQWIGLFQCRNEIPETIDILENLGIILLAVQVKLLTVPNLCDAAPDRLQSLEQINIVGQTMTKARFS